VEINLQVILPEYILPGITYVKPGISKKQKKL